MAIDRNLDRQIKKGAVEAAAKAEIVNRISTSTHVDEHRRADLVVESAVESLTIKSEIFRQLDELCPAATLLASNTSSISITRLAAVTGRPDRIVGMHFMNPVPVMRLVEVVRGLETSDTTVSTIRRVAERMGKIPVECADHPGFVSNRLLMPMINEAIFAVSEGIATPESIDKIMTLGANHPMGPLRIADLIGLDNCLSVMRILRQIPTLPTASEDGGCGQVGPEVRSRLLLLRRGLIGALPALRSDQPSRGGFLSSLRQQALGVVRRHRRRPRNHR